MKNYFLSLIISILCAYSVKSQDYELGRVRVDLNDESRSRTIPVEVYYPALSSGENADWAEGEFPLIILGHGFAMTYAAYENYAEYFVPRGYVFAMIDTENGLVGVDHEDFGLDYVFVKNNLGFASNLNSKVAYMGHSMGGGAAFIAASQDEGPDLLIGLAPAETNPSAIAASSSVIAPTFVFSGEGDNVTPPQDSHIPIYNACSAVCKGFINIIGGAHCYFALSNFFCDFGETTAGSDIQIQRGEQQSITYSLLEPLFQSFLLNDEDAFQIFSDSLSQSYRINGSLQCDDNPLELQNKISEDLLLYPSPAAEFIHVELAALEKQSFNVMNFQGQIVLKGELESGINTLQLQGLRTGLYVLVTGSSRITFMKR